MKKKIEDLKEYKQNAIDVLRKNTQYATAMATEQAFDTLIAYYTMIVNKYVDTEEGAE